MKNAVILSLMTAIACLGTAKAQITLEHEFAGLSAASVELPTAGFRYYVMDAGQNQCRIYTPEYALWKTISLPVTNGDYLVDIQYVSENLFNSDNAIELLFVTYRYDTTLGYGTYATYVAGESGAILLSVPGGGYSVVYPAKSGSKLFVWIYDYSVSLYATATRVFGLPGSGSQGSGLGFDEGQSLPAFPNPSSGFIRIPVRDDLQGQALTMIIHNTAGQIQWRQTIPAAPALIEVDARSLKPGTYYYQLSFDDRPGMISQKNKFVMTR